MFDKIRIVEVRKETVNHNPISKHSWIEIGDVIGYEVVGGGFTRTKHKNLRKAEQEKALREHMLEKFPYLRGV